MLALVSGWRVCHAEGVQGLVPSTKGSDGQSLGYQHPPALRDMCHHSIDRGLLSLCCMLCHMLVSGDACIVDVVYVRMLWSPTAVLHISEGGQHVCCSACLSVCHSMCVLVLGGEAITVGVTVTATCRSLGNPLGPGFTPSCSCGAPLACCAAAHISVHAQECVHGATLARGHGHAHVRKGRPCTHVRL
jgi:hypothetical protein